MRAKSWWRVRCLILAVVAALLVIIPLAPASAQETVPGHGINVVDMDRSVDPAVDFYRFANGGWLDRTSIPPDFASIETMSALEGHTRAQLISLVQQRATAGDLTPGSDEWKAVRLFQQGVDLQTRNAQGMAPIQPILDEIDGIDDLASFHRFQQTSVFRSMPGLFFVSAGPDLEDSTQTVAYLHGPSLALGPREYYISQDATVLAAQQSYVATAAHLLTISGVDAAEAPARARAVFAFESALASDLLTREEAQDFALSYNPMTPAQLAAQYPLLDWTAYFHELGLDHLQSVIVTEPHYLAQLATTIEATPLAVLRDELRLQLLWSASANLNEAMENTAFAFYGTTLNGLQVIAPIEGRTLDQVSLYLADAIGQIYVNAYFSPAAKAQSEELVQQIVAAYHLRLEHNAWMTDETKAKALQKLDQLRVKVGYPNTWRSYVDVEITDSYFGSALSAFDVFYRHSLAAIGKPVDASAWPFPPQTVNAMYNPLANEIIIPAAMLQPPFFDPAADPASNFGAIGYVIGHEITHGFDLRGSQFDGNGNLVNWWTDVDRAQFQKLNDQLAEQYSHIAVLDGAMVDGQLTLAENVADLGGVQVAYDALRAHLLTHGLPQANQNASDYSQDQRFFIAAATVWRAEVRDAALRTQLVSDPHAPATVRGTQPLRNCDAFFTAFAIAPGDPMYLPPAQRVVIW